MYATNLGLHFSTDQAFGGLVTVEGILRVDPQKVLLEYHKKDNLVRVLKSKNTLLEIPYQDLQEVNYKRNWFVSRFQLEIKNLHILQQFPASKNGIISLSIPRKQKEIAKEIASYINLRISEIRLASMDSDHDEKYL